MKKVLLPVIALLVLFAVTPVMAAPAAKIPFTAETSFGFGNVYPGEPITEDGILCYKGIISEGTTEVHSVLGDMSGALTIIHDLVINQNIGLGECHGKFVITIEGVGTFEGSEHGTHTIIPHPDPPYFKDVISGKLVAHGTGGFAGFKMMGSYEAEMIAWSVEMALEGIIIFPEG